MPDIPELLSLVPAIDPDARTVAWTQDLLRSYSVDKRGVRHGAFSRVVVGKEGILGHISANLISNSAGDALEHLKDKAAIYDLTRIAPICDDELSIHNRAGGSTLLITSFFWRAGPIDNVDFLLRGFDPIVRWFEGNRISSIMFTVDRNFKLLVSGPLLAFSQDRVVVQEINDRFFLIRARGPLGIVTPTMNWAKKLLREPRSYELTLPDKYKLTGRVLHEFGFELRDVCKSGCLDWQWYEDQEKTQDKCPSYRSWRNAAVDNLQPAYGADGKARDATNNLKALLKRYPNILAP